MEFPLVTASLLDGTSAVPESHIIVLSFEYIAKLPSVLYSALYGPVLVPGSSVLHFIVSPS